MPSGSQASLHWHEAEYAVLVLVEPHMESGGVALAEELHQFLVRQTVHHSSRPPQGMVSFKGDLPRVRAAQGSVTVVAASYQNQYPRPALSTPVTGTYAPSW